MSDQWGQNGGRPEFAPPELPRPALPNPYSPPPPAEPPSGEPVGPRLTMKTGVALVAGLVAILVVSGAVTVWATSARPQSAMPAAWTAEPTSAPTGGQHAPLPVATGNRATSSTTVSTTARTTSSGTATKGPSASAQASTTTTNGTLPSCLGGQTVTTTVFSLKVPAGWKCFEQTTSGTGTIIGMYNDGMDIIQVTVTPSKDAVTACGVALAKQSSSVVAQPDTVWGGHTAKTAKVTVSSLTAQARCAESKGTIYMMVGAPARGTLDSVVAAMGTVTSAWVWT